LIKAWASQKSYQPKDPEDREKKNTTDFHGQKRSNATHESVTDHDARLYKKSAGDAAQLCYMDHVLMENRNGLVNGLRSNARGDETGARCGRNHA